jgi:hypothetical protein
VALRSVLRGAAVCALAATAPLAASAAEPNPRIPPVAPAAAPSPEFDPGEWILKRKHTLAELEVGFIALPTAPISAGQQGGNTPIGTIGRGDATASLGMHLLFRGGADWALGAGALFAPRPTSDNEYGTPAGLQRTHSRDYLWLGGEGRYIPIHYRTIEAWVGVSIGTVIIADRFSTDAPPVPSALGTSATTIRTEGFSVGIQGGADWAFTESFIAGLALRFDHWILPSSGECTSFGDCATLTGPVTEIEFGLRLGYRIAL